MSTSTGPGRPLAAIANASRIAGATSLARVTRIVVLGDRQRDAGDVGLLERVGSDERAADLAGDADDRRRVHHRGRDAGHHVRRAGPGGRDGDADLPGRARVAVGHVRRALLVAHEDVADRIVEHRVVRRQDRAARIAEDDVHALAHEAVPENLRAGQCLSCSYVISMSSATESRRVRKAQNGSACLRDLCGSVYPVIAPVDADDTSRAYFAITPV